MKITIELELKKKEDYGLFDDMVGGGVNITAMQDGRAMDLPSGLETDLSEFMKWKAEKEAEFLKSQDPKEEGDFIL